jgi:hypothetical protein
MQVAGVPTEETYQIGHKLGQMIHHGKTLLTAGTEQCCSSCKGPMETSIYAALFMCVVCVVTQETDTR